MAPGLFAVEAEIVRIGFGPRLDQMRLEHLIGNAMLVGIGDRLFAWCRIPAPAAGACRSSWSSPSVDQARARFPARIPAAMAWCGPCPTAWRSWPACRCARALRLSSSGGVFPHRPAIASRPRPAPAGLEAQFPAVAGLSALSRARPCHSNRPHCGRFEWSERRDLNTRPSAPKADALPGCATLR